MAGSRREAVLLCYLLSGGLGLVAIFLTQANQIEAIAVGSAVLLFAFYGIWWLEFRTTDMQKPDDVQKPEPAAKIST